MVDALKDRIGCKKLMDRIASAEVAVGAIDSGMTIGVCSDLLPICRALERRATGRDQFRLRLVAGVAILEADRILGNAGIIQHRVGQQTLLRRSINNGDADYLDSPLGLFYQSMRRGDFGSLDWAIVEAIRITEEGHLVPSYRLHDMPNFVLAAKRVIVQLNTYYPPEIEGMHDVYIPSDPPNRQPIPIRRVDDRIGTPYIPVDPEKIAFIVGSDSPEPMDLDHTIDDASRRIGMNLVELFRDEVSLGKLPPRLLPIEMGLGAVPSAVLDELGKSEFENLEFYSAVLNDRILNLIAKGKVRAASGTGFFLTAEGERELLQNLALYKRHVVLRPVEIADCPEVILRLGGIALNGAVEVDIYGHVNSSHVMSGDVISGIGGASEFALNAYLSVILLPSVAKSGEISSIVPMVSHVDISEHGVDVVVTEQGVADLRGLTPKERAEAIIGRCAHPDYRPHLQDYCARAVAGGGGHEPHLLDEALSFHQRFLRTGTMKP
jgi:succinyl-CoA:acetate CoA-transferase